MIRGVTKSLLNDSRTSLVVHASWRSHFSVLTPQHTRSPTPLSVTHDTHTDILYCVTQRHTCRTATYAQDQNPKLATGDHEHKEVTHPPTDTHRGRCAHTETYKQDKNSGHPSDQPSPVEHDQKVVTHAPLRVHRIVRTGAECRRAFQRQE